MRPVQRDPVAEEPAEQFVDRDAEPLRLDVPQREVDRGEDLLAFRDAGPAAVPDPLVHQLDPARVLADEPAAHDLERGLERCGRVPVVGLGPADDALIGGDLEEAELPQTAVADEGLDGRDSHCWPSLLD